MSGLPGTTPQFAPHAVMGKVYAGIGHHYQRYPVPGYVAVYEEDESGSRTHVGRLTDRVRHTPGEFAWSETGSRRSDLARSLLWDVLGREPEARACEQFEREYIANWPMKPGECWRIAEQEISDWLAARGPDRPSTPSAGEVQSPDA